MFLSDFGIILNKKIWDLIKDFFYYQRIPDTSVVLNINDDCRNDQKRALLCYLPYSFFYNWESAYLGRTQPFEIMKIVKVFSEFGYAVDIIGCNDLKAVEIIKDRNYNVIFGFGESFFKLTNLYPNVSSILLMTENTPEFSFKQEKDRMDYFFLRHGRKLKLARSGKFYKIKHLEKKYSHVITMGETELLKDKYSNPSFIFPTGLINARYVFSNKDHLQARHNYLWFGSTGAIHKGLDILIDVFSKRDDVILHICGLNKEEKKILKFKGRSNMFDYGRIDVNSGAYLQLVNKCSYIILPSCSEGFSTSVTTGMLHGLIPVVIRNTGFNRAGDHAIFLEDYKLEYVNNKLNELSDFDPAELCNLSRKVYEFAQKNFRLEAFEDNFRTIITSLRIEI